MMKHSLAAGGLSVAMVSSMAGFAPGALAQAPDVPAHEVGEESALTANIGVTSNYVWRGATQTRNGPAVQGGIDYGHAGSGVYVGLWLSNVDFGGTEVADVLDADGNPTGETVEYSVSAPEFELDAYVGWAWDFTDTVGLDLGYVYYNYGQYESGFDFGEVYGAVSLWWFDLGINYTVNSQVDDPDDTAAFVVGDFAYYGAFGFDFLQSWNLSFTLGQYVFENDSSDNELTYAWGQIDLTKSAGRYGDFTLSVSQAGEEANGGNDNAKVFLTWHKGWDFKR